MSENIKNNNPVIAAGIDIGSNSIRMLVAKVTNGKIVEFIASERAATRLAAGIKTTGRLSDESFEKSLRVLEKFAEIIRSTGAEKVKAFATSAVREASNGREFITATKMTGIDIEIITGCEEANIVYSGVNAGMDTGDNPLIFDAGGGSTEFIAARNGEITLAESYKIGVVKLVDMFDISAGTMGNIDKCRIYIKNFFSPLILPSNCTKLIATAGTATTVSAIKQSMKTYDWQLINGSKLVKKDIESTLELILSIPYEKRLNVIGMERGREDLIIPGMLIMLEVMEKSQFDELTVSDFGLREGAVIAAANS